MWDIKLDIPKINPNQIKTFFSNRIEEPSSHIELKNARPKKRAKIF
jgi:hypothetical protein